MVKGAKCSTNHIQHLRHTPDKSKQAYLRISRELSRRTPLRSNEGAIAIHPLCACEGEKRTLRPRRDEERKARSIAAPANAAFRVRAK